MNTPQPLLLTLALIAAVGLGSTGSALAAGAAVPPPHDPAASAAPFSKEAAPTGAVEEIRVVETRAERDLPRVTAGERAAVIDDGARSVRLQFRPSLKTRSLFRLSMN